MSTSEHPQGGYERTDAHIPSIWKFIVGLFALIGVALLLSLGLFRYLYRSEQADVQAATPMESKRVLPPAPRLQINGTADYSELRRKEEEALTSYGWVDKNAGVVRIPVSRAMELIAARGLTPPPRQKQERAGAAKKQ